ncbi:hypothetical protein [Thaumasiovibrio subtropicus]|uniref:hypothetical protein n=1 Tax=Thaumasiovibrio subtropicus TaxID=1891207 RepID=UPI000B35B91E|nr:hypothetical protein [Thaumasiovibrio subtropicus]
MNSAKWLVLSMMFVGPLFGCASTTRFETLQSLGFEREYLDGYQDGCFSRTEGGNTHLNDYRQDYERMLKDVRYNNGWNDGYRQCMASNQRLY